MMSAVTGAEMVGFHGHINHQPLSRDMTKRLTELAFSDPVASEPSYQADAELLSDFPTAVARIR
jgi:hypothetical protein